MECIENCNNNGECLTVNEYNQRHGLLVIDTLENENIRKCFCYKGYIGNNCNETECSYGVDKNEYNYYTNKYGEEFQNSPILKFKCNIISNDDNNNNIITLHINNNKINIQYNSNLNDLKYKFISESGLLFNNNNNNMEIKSTTKSAVCAKDGNEIEIVFPHNYCVEEFNIYFEYDRNIFNISDFSFASDKKCYECSNRGICDSRTGRCKCFGGFTSGDDGIDNCSKEDNNIGEEDL